MTILKKGGYFSAVITVSLVLIVLYLLFFTSDKATPNHEDLALKPVTAEEQQDLIVADMKKEDRVIVSGPITAIMDIQDAQTRVLYPNVPQNTAAQ